MADEKPLTKKERETATRIARQILVRNALLGPAGDYEGATHQHCRSIVRWAATCDVLEARIDEAHAAGERLRALIEKMREENGYEERVRHDEEVIDDLAQIATVFLGAKS